MVAGAQDWLESLQDHDCDAEVLERQLASIPKLKPRAGQRFSCQAGAHLWAVEVDCHSHREARQREHLVGGYLAVDAVLCSSAELDLRRQRYALAGDCWAADEALHVWQKQNFHWDLGLELWLELDLLGFPDPVGSIDCCPCRHLETDPSL